MASLDRRKLITGALGAAALPGLALASAPASGKLNFAITRQGKPFGQYVMTFVRNGDSLKITTDAAMAYRFAGITTFDYHHHCEEIWVRGQFIELHSRSIRDGHVTDTISAIRSDNQVIVNTAAGRLAIPGPASPLTHWNNTVLTGPLFNPQDGVPLQLTGRNVGRDQFPTAGGGKITADHWMLRGDQQIDEWYDDAGVWAGLRAVFPDKSIVEYHRI